MKAKSWVGTPESWCFVMVTRPRHTASRKSGFDREVTETGYSRAQCKNIEQGVTRLDRVTRSTFGIHPRPLALSINITTAKGRFLTNFDLIYPRTDCASISMSNRGMISSSTGTRRTPNQEGDQGGVMKSWGCGCAAFIAVSLRAFRGERRVFSVRRGSHDPAGVPDRRSPVLIVGPGFKGICAVRAHSEGRRPSVRHLAGSGDPRPTKARNKN